MIPQRHRTASTLAVSRSIHSSSSWRNSTLSMPSLGGPCARDLEHRLGPVARDQRAPGADQLGRHEAGVPGPGGELEHPLARLQTRARRPSRPRPASPNRGSGRRGCPNPSAARSHVSRLSARCSSGSIVLIVEPHPRRRCRDDRRRTPSRSGRSSAGRRSPPAPRWPAVASWPIDSSISRDRATGIPAASERLPDLIDEQPHERLRDRVAVLLDLLEHGERAVERHAARDHPLGDRQQRRAGYLEAAVGRSATSTPRRSARAEHARRRLRVRPEKRRPSSAAVSVCAAARRARGQRLAEAASRSAMPLAVVEQVLDRRQVEALLPAGRGSA